MEGKKNLCAVISTDLHGKIMAEKEQLELNTLAEYESLPQHCQAGTGGSGAARLSCQAAPIPSQWEQYLQPLYAEINEKWIVQNPGTIHFIKQKNKNRHAKRQLYLFAEPRRGSIWTHQNHPLYRRIRTEKEQARWDSFQAGNQRRTRRI